MHTILDQISALLSSAPINSLQNSELIRQLPASGLFSSLLSEYSSGAEDANIAALSGNIVPATPAQNSVSAATDVIVNNSGGASNEIISDSAKIPALVVASINVDSAVPQAQTLNNPQLQQVVAGSVSDKLLNRSEVESKGFIDKPGNLNLLEDSRSYSKPPPIDNSKLENLVRSSGVDQPLPPVSNQIVRDPQNDLRVNPARNAATQVLPSEQPTPVTEKLNIRELQSEVATRPPATTVDIGNTTTKPHTEPIFVNNGSLSENSVSQNKSTLLQASTSNAPVNLLDPRERLLTPIANNQIITAEDAPLFENKISPDTTRPVGNQVVEVVNRPFDQNRFAVDVETIAPQRRQEALTQFDATDIRKENIIASTAVREQSEYTKQVDNRISLQHKPEDLYKITSTQDRPVVRSDYSSPAQQNFIAESAPAVKIIEINIDQKSPVTINIGADALSSLKSLNSDYQILPSREILQSDSSSPFVRTSEIRNGNDIADHIAWARQNNAQQVRISVSPEHLGAVDISIDDAPEGLNIQFVTQNLQAKEALELFMPRLKEMLEQSGLNLQNASVSQYGEGKSQFNLANQSSDELFQQEMDDDVAVSQSDVMQHQDSNASDQLLDAFA